MLKFKTPAIELEFKRINPKLQSILYMAAGYLDTKHRENLTVTCLFRDNSRSVHHTGRGADTRITHPNHGMWDELIDFILKHARYGKEGHNIIFDERTGRSGGWTGPHFHWQVRDNTELI